VNANVRPHIRTSFGRFVVLITAHLKNSAAAHHVSVSTADSAKVLPVPAKPGGLGSAVNGGEFLMLALATCYCNDLYREAARLKIRLDAVEVEARPSCQEDQLPGASVISSGRE
jgi:organic hydroperoxide reductase OsmC/OhrA